ncbi:MAG: glutathione S-transferase N-terminal domain-containing protein [Pseudomonadota bacterium]
MAIDLYTAATPNGWKASIMIEELKEAGVSLPDVTVHSVNLREGEQFSDTFTAVNPNQKIPALVHDGRAIMESCAILQYLGEQFPTSLLPLGEGKWDVIPWLYWQAANLGPAFGNKLSYTRYMDDVDPIKKEHPLTRFNTEAQRLVSILEKRLTFRQFVCGEDFTVADIAIWPWARGWKWSKVDITGSPAVMAWVDRVRARPGVERGISYGVPKDEIDQWSAERKAQYAKTGTSIASNTPHKSS